MSCTGLNTINPLCQLKDAVSGVTTDAFSNMADEFAQTASSAANGLWDRIGSATTINLASAPLTADLVATGAIAIVVCLGLFLIQVVTSLLRRDPGGLGRAVRGLFVAMVASVFALGATKLALDAVDHLSEGVVAYTMHTNMAGLGHQLALADIVGSTANPAALLLLSIVVLAAVVVVWAAMMVRKMLIIIAAVLTPLAFSGATADFTRSWVRKWIEFTAAMVAAKLLLVIILMIGVSVLEGGGQASGGGVGQDVTQLVVGALILLMGGFAPWVAIKMFHFAGDSLIAAHGYAAAAPAGARTVAAAPPKVAAIHRKVSSTATSLRGIGGTGAPAGGVTRAGSPGPASPSSAGPGAPGAVPSLAFGRPAAVGAARNGS
ncbi:MAG: hypothetical protein ACRDPG_14375, partial [Nocardioidaceae bacterium]